MMPEDGTAPVGKRLHRRRQPHDRGSEDQRDRHLGRHRAADGARRLCPADRRAIPSSATSSRSGPSSRRHRSRHRRGGGRAVHIDDAVCSASSRSTSSTTTGRPTSAGPRRPQIHRSWPRMATPLIYVRATDYDGDHAIAAGQPRDPGRRPEVLHGRLGLRQRQQAWRRPDRRGQARSERQPRLGARRRQGRQARRRQDHLRLRRRQARSPRGQAT